MQKIQFVLGLIIGFIIAFSVMMVFLFSSFSHDFRKSADPCPYIFQEIKLLEMSNQMQLGESATMNKHWNLLQEYVQKGCPSYEGLELQINMHKQTTSKT
ncbi:hypothetical protein DSQ19_04005 [Candidatus Nitrosotenuis sp. DW1]|nr:hypothetical protein DSQ19_04005 [Candidatus Nitrosotenuis sp. DW1]